MKHFYSKSFLAALTLAAGSMTLSARQANSIKHDLDNYRYKVHNSSAFKGDRQAKINEINERLIAADERLKANSRAAAGKDESVKPIKQLGPTSFTGDLDAPNGELWFYTANFDYLEIPPHDNVWFTDRILQSYEFTIYDSHFNIVGTIKDKMDYQPGEIRTVTNDLLPVLTRNFFNDDDKIEIVLGLGVNVADSDHYEPNHYRSVIYSIDGEKDADGDDVPILTMNSLVGDVIEGPATPDGKDNFFITFTEDVESSANINNAYWDYVSGNAMKMSIYSSARGTGAPRKLFEKDIKLLNLPGDQQYSPFMVSLVRNGKVYIVQSEYEQPFYNRYDSADEDLSMREGNKLLVNFYLVDENEVKLDYTTAIDVVKDAADNRLASYYSVGGLRYREDIDFDNYPSADRSKACLIVTKDNYIAGSDDSYISSYYVYGANGKRALTLFEDCTSTISLSNLEGTNPVQLFITENSGDYGFNVVDLITGKRTCYISSQYYIEEYDDTEALYANVDRVADGNDYKIVFELRYPTIDDYDNDVMRILWLNSDGTFDHIDYVNMGMNVQYAQSFIYTKALNANFYDSDANHEYMLLVKRGLSSSDIQEELIIGKAYCEDYPEGKTLLTVTPSDEYGPLNNISPIEQGDGSYTLLVGFYDSVSRTYTDTYYNLPLDGNAGVDNVTADTDSDITFDGTVIKATGTVSLYTTAGVLVAQGNGEIDTTGITPGLYIAAGENGTAKIAVK
ncbi:MAG: hypothetical protein HDR82_03415 [Bacteroides sp.]|nr:hypothetical protein [Bacteroides sp.]